MSAWNPFSQPSPLPSPPLETTSPHHVYDQSHLTSLEIPGLSPALSSTGRSLRCRSLPGQAPSTLVGAARMVSCGTSAARSSGTATARVDCLQLRARRAQRLAAQSSLREGSPLRNFIQLSFTKSPSIICHPRNVATPARPTPRSLRRITPIAPAQRDHSRGRARKPNERRRV